MIEGKRLNQKGCIQKRRRMGGQLLYEQIEWLSFDHAHSINTIVMLKRIHYLRAESQFSLQRYPRWYTLGSVSLPIIALTCLATVKCTVASNTDSGGARFDIAH